jgi:hypothetical protein
MTRKNESEVAMDFFSKSEISSHNMNSLFQFGERELTDNMRECLENCFQCHRACEQLIPHCLAMSGKHASREHIEILSLCADICRTSAHFMMWNSDLHHRVCGVCAEVCMKCAEDCEQMVGADEMMLACAQICRKCSASCSMMSLH